MGPDVREWKKRLGEALTLLRPKLAQADDSRRLVKLAAGEETHAWGTAVKARTSSLVLMGLSRDFVTVAVLEGSIVLGNQNVHSGDALVKLLDSGKTRLLKFNASRLAATLPPKWRDHAAGSLDAISEKQRRPRLRTLLGR